MFLNEKKIRRIRFVLFVFLDLGSDIVVYKECIGKKLNIGSRGKFFCNWFKVLNRKFFFDINFCCR